MTERQIPYLDIAASEFKPTILSEIDRPFEERVRLFDYKDALVVDDNMVVAYKHLWLPERGKGDRVLVARERTTPIKIEKTGKEVLYPYPNEEELRGKYGVLIIDVFEDRPAFYVGEQYKIIFERSYCNTGYRSADIKIESTKPIKSDFIDGQSDYNHYLALLNTPRKS